MGLDYGFMNSVERADFFVWNFHTLDSVEEMNEDLADVWVSCEYPRFVAPYEIWTGIFKRVGFCSDVDGLTLDDMDEEITIYRSAPTGYADGMSWTTSLETAEWFNNRNHLFERTSSKVYKVTIPKSEILGVFEERKEKEIVVSYETAKKYGATIVEVTPNPDALRGTKTISEL